MFSLKRCNTFLENDHMSGIYIYINNNNNKTNNATLRMLNGCVCTCTYLYFNNFAVFVPVPDRQHVLIRIINYAQKCPGILCQNIQQPLRPDRFSKHLLPSSRCALSHACRCKVRTALEKATDPTPRSNVPRPICCSVVSVVESQMCTKGCKGWRANTDDYTEL